MTIKQTAGRVQLGDFAPDFAHYNDDILFGQNWNQPDLNEKQRCMLTISSLISQGICDASLKAHLENGKAHGISQKEIAALITHTAFYAGWPKAWAAFRLAKDVWQDDDGKASHASKMPFPIGSPNDAFAQYFDGQSYLAPISTEQVGIFNVTFEPGCRNHWHIHKAGGQILIGAAGTGWYQEEGKPAVVIKPGDVVNIPAGVKHWHGAAKDNWFSHLAIEVPAEGGGTIWLEPVNEEEYDALESKD